LSYCLCIVIVVERRNFIVVHMYQMFEKTHCLELPMKTVIRSSFGSDFCTRRTEASARRTWWSWRPGNLHLVREVQAWYTRLPFVLIWLHEAQGWAFHEWKFVDFMPSNHKKKCLFFVTMEVECGRGNESIAFNN
jgi:hypothetical protein